MPRLPEEPPADGVPGGGGFQIPVRRFGALVVGSGAAGLRAAVELKRRGVEVAVLTQSAWGGTSACSGSDKQTLHTANSADRGDDFAALAEAIGAGGAMDDDTAYVEAVGSARALASLQYLGLAGARGSLRRRVALSDRSRRSRPRDQLRAAHLAADGAGAGARGDPARHSDLQPNHRRAHSQDEGERACGVLAMQPQRRRSPTIRSAWPPSSAAIWCLQPAAPANSTATASIPGTASARLGLALEAGVEAVNLTESQFGIGTSRDGFPWNLSGTYAQAMPYVYSLDSEGTERNFLADYYRTTRELASNLFRKGYQWPFHATRMLDFGSSLFDLAVFRERQAGRRVFMDFNRNPEPSARRRRILAVPVGCGRHGLSGEVRRLVGDAHRAAAAHEPVVHRALQALQARHHARAAGVRHQQPAHERRSRRRCLGPHEPARLLRRGRGGGDAWRHAAGRRGAERRPGVRDALRRAYRLAARRRRAAVDEVSLLSSAVAEALSVLRLESPLAVDAVRQEVQARMSDHAGLICDARRRARCACGGPRAQRGYPRARASPPTAPSRRCGRCNGGIWRWRPKRF